MPKYSVTVTETMVYVVNVEAPNRLGARLKALRKVEESDDPQHDFAGEVGARRVGDVTQDDEP